MSKKKRSKFLDEIKDIDCLDKLIVTQKGKKRTYSFRGELANEFLKDYMDLLNSKENFE